MTRVSVDLDVDDLERALHIRDVLERHTGVTVKVWRTVSRHYHVVTDHVDGLTPHEALALRYILHDDPSRLAWDCLRLSRGAAWDFLFDVKNGTRRQRVA